ncbi:MAG TPA: serine/threonine-protein kinase [Ktedonobacterales bacterium]
MDGNTLNPLSLGTIVHKRYRVDSIVGRGGLGTVYSVLDILFGKNNIYALKEMADQSRSARRQFEHEAQWLQALDHNHIPKVREYFEWQSRLYLVMDFVDGENLEQKLYRQGGRPLPEEQVIAWILPICDALNYLHTRRPSILHRDVKPANIIVTPAGHPVLVDLGIAKEHLPGANRTATFVRKAGTEGYAPPEQYTTAGKSGPWSDVYALGATLYHLLTVHVPTTAIERVTMDPDLVRPRAYNNTISEQTDAAICRAMAMRPSERFQSVADFAAALSGSTAAFSGPISGTLPGPMPPHAPSSPYASGWEASGLTPPRSAISQPFSQPQSASQPAPGQRPPAFTPPRTPPPSRNPSFTGSHPSVTGMGRNAGINPGMNQGRMGVPLPPLPPISPSITDSVRHASQPTLREAPGKTAERFDRIRTSIAGSRKAPADLRAGSKSPNRGLLFTGIALVMILAAVGIATFMVVPRLAPPDRSSPRATITGYFDALQQDDTGRAWQFTSASRNDTATQDIFTRNLRADDTSFGKVLSIKIITVETDSSSHATAVVQATRANAPGNPITYSIALSQYDGTTWLVDSVTTQ